METNIPQASSQQSNLPPASLLRRLGAILYDSLLLLAVLFIATALTLPLTDGKAVPSGNPLYRAYLFCICFFFYSWFWIHGGQTLGLRAWKIRVQCQDGTALGWWQALVRFLLGGLWVVPMIGLTEMLGLDWKLSLVVGLSFLLLTLVGRLHDRYSDTVLVLIKPQKKSD